MKTAACHINTGRVLSRPWQSASSKIRCVLLANMSVDRKELAPWLKANGLTQDSTGIRPDWRFETVSLSAESPRFPKSRVTPFRNCPACSRIGFHCDLYNYPWMVRCPLHPDQVIRDRCPECHCRWFADITWSNSCETCGNRIVVKQLINNNAFDPPLNMQAIADIAHALQLGEWRPVELSEICNCPSRYLTGSFQVPQDSVYYPSLIAALMPERRRLFERYHIPLTPCDVLTEPVSTAYDPDKDGNGLCINDFNRLFHASTWERSLLAAADKTLLQLVRQRDQCLPINSEILGLVEWWVNQASHWQLAYLFWKHLSAYRRSRDTYRKSYYLSFVFDNDLYNREPLLLPCPIVQTGLAFADDAHSCATPEIMWTPSPIKRKIFEIDAWMLFIKIFFHVDRLLCQRMDTQFHTVLHCLPEHIHDANYSHGQDIGLFINNDYKLSLIYPRALCHALPTLTTFTSDTACADFLHGVLP